MRQPHKILIYLLFSIVISLLGVMAYLTSKAPKLRIIDLPKVEGEVGDKVNINLLPNTVIRDNTLIIKEEDKYILNKEGEGVLYVDNKADNIIYKAVVSVKKKSTFSGIITDKLSAPLSNYFIVMNNNPPIAINSKGKFTVMLSNPNEHLDGSTLSLLNKDKTKKVSLGTIQYIQHQYKLIPNQTVCTVPNKELNIIKLNVSKPKTPNVPTTPKSNGSKPTPTNNTTVTKVIKSTK